MILVAICAVLQGGQIFLQDPGHSLILSGFDHNAALKSDTAGSIDFRGEGSPLKIEYRTQGLTLQALSASGTVIPSGPTLSSLTLHGGVDAKFDTAVRLAWLKESGGKPPSGGVPTITEVRCDEFDYHGTPTTGTFQAPTPVTITMHQEGTVVRKKSTIHFVQDLTMHGVSGNGAIDPSASLLQSLDLAGPVDWTLVRTEDAETHTYTGLSDNLHFEQGGKIAKLVMSGHAHLEGSGAVFMGEANFDQATITLDETFQPVAFEASGSPATTRLAPRGKP